MTDAAPDPATDREDRADRSGAHAPHQEVETPVFPGKPFFRVGYDRHAVDQFVALVALAVRKERQTSVTADDVARTRFPSRRFGPGYRMRDVDDYLGVVEALLRTRATAHGVGPVASSDDAQSHHREHHPTWWIYGVAAVLIVVIVVFTVLQT